ncbi:hypothetical protein [Nonlabens agnitus]|uniref:Uncharacterized protein n=1 Tax=Nonlabens agnitus TaxID=870484 RepID=A0A2S9WXJ5_9FLAO|nr:hypothetical protein [Nonlabens agnitus]PRP68198.1 hypothetical protein BST86_14440 [Nonlabens agnitus]
MNTEVKTPTTTLQLVKGKFNKTEASHVVTTLLQHKINFHKVQKWQLWEANNKLDCRDIDNRVNELELDLENFEEFMKQIEVTGCSIKIEGKLKITIEE